MASFSSTITTFSQDQAMIKGQGFEKLNSISTLIKLMTKNKNKQNKEVSQNEVSQNDNKFL